MIRVLHYIPGYSYGGIESMFLAWYKYIYPNEIQFDLLMRTQDDNCTGIESIKRMNGNYYRLTPISNIINFKRSVTTFFKEHHDYDILHVHEADPFIMKTAKRYGIEKIIIHAHTTSYGNDIKGKLRFINEQITMRLFANYAFACSMLAAQWKFGGMKFKKNEVSIIKNAIISEQFEYSPTKREEIRSSMNLKEEFVIGHVGRMTTPKNQFFLLDIFHNYTQINPDSILLMIGDGPDENELKKYSKEIGIKDKVLFLGTRNNIPELLQGMDCFLLPSKWEGLPVTLMEAQASGLPCVISDVISEEADITNNVFRYALSESPENWAKRIDKLRVSFVRESTRNQIIDNGFDMEHEVISLVEKYKMIVSENS